MFWKQKTRDPESVSGELAEWDKAECWGQLHYFSILVKAEEPKVLFLLFRTKRNFHN